MKKLFFVLAFFIIAGYASAQDTEPRSPALLNFGVGLSEWGVPVYVGLDFWVSRDITLGGELSFRAYRENWKNNYYHHSIVGIAGNANYHFNRILRIPQNWDFYAGLNIGFYFWSSPDNYNGTYTSGLGLAGQIGGRYFFNNRIGLNLEFGGGNAFSGGKFGLSFKI